MNLYDSKNKEEIKPFNKKNTLTAATSNNTSASFIEAKSPPAELKYTNSAGKLQKLSYMLEKPNYSLLEKLYDSLVDKFNILEDLLLSGSEVQTSQH